MSQAITIQALDGVESSTLNLNTPIPIQRANVEKFESVELNQVKDTIYAYCATDGATAAKVAYLTNFLSCTVEQGTCVTVIFENANTADNITLKLQDYSKGDIMGNVAVMAMGSALLQLGSGSIPANARIKFEYDGTYWQAHTDIVKRSSSSVTHADGTVSYTALSSLDTSSAAAVNSSAVNGALADLSTLKTTYKTDANECVNTKAKNQKSTFYLLGTASNLPSDVTQYDYCVIEVQNIYISGTVNSVYQELLTSSRKKYIRYGAYTDTSIYWLAWEQVTTASVLTTTLSNYTNIQSQVTANSSYISSFNRTSFLYNANSKFMKVQGFFIVSTAIPTQTTFFTLPYKNYDNTNNAYFRISNAELSKEYTVKLKMSSEEISSDDFSIPAGTYIIEGCFLVK